MAMHVPACQRAKRLILHIGAAKTGSTSIQVALAANRAALLEKGVLYPASLGARTHSLVTRLATPLWRDLGRRGAGPIRALRAAAAERQNLVTALGAEIDAHRPETLVISYEGLFNRFSDRASVGRLATVCAALAETVTVVVFLRRQDEALVSEFVHGRRLGATREFVLLDEIARAPHLDYTRQLRHWEDRFGIADVRAVPFVRAGFPNRDVVDFFAGILGVDPVALPHAAETNLGLDMLKEEFLQRFNALLPRYEKSAANEARWGIYDAIDEHVSARRKRGIPLAEREAILARFAASNAALARRHGGTAGAFFPPLEDMADDPDVDSLTVEDAVGIAADLWTWSAEQLLHFRKELDDMRRTRARLEAELAEARGEAGAN
ncbi:MAG TPA: hypothetical protein PLJ34_11115 [Hyphomicrobiales bacterium]|nr:hypothetical protein [Kaistiaceae bacterium]HQF31982.1 hypothetical protein [Hyphomicrobiales bacterium]